MTALAAEETLVLGRYRPLRPLGLDSPSAVWLAHDDRTGAEVALKHFERDPRLGSLVGSTAEAEREIEAVRRLSHEGCPRALDFAHDDERLYIVYEYVPSRNLAECPELALGQVVELLAQVCDGLAHAHGLGIVHRDVKPTNILVEDGPTVSARIVDFEKAQLDGIDTIPRTSLAPGALPYISPEVIRRETATERSDVWCVGLILALAAGRSPFPTGIGRQLAPLDGKPEGTGTVVLTERERKLIEERILAGVPPIAASRPDLPDALTAAIDAALSVDPEGRPSAAQLAAELHGAVAEAKEAHTHDKEE